MRVYLAKPRGFCAGVDRAIETVERALAIFGPPVYVRHEIVHNAQVVSRLREAGAIFVDEVTEIPAGAPTVFSAHGIAPQVRVAAALRNLDTIDAACPLVTKVHMEAQKYAKDGCQILLIGHRGHIEVEGTLGEAPELMQLVTSEEDAEKVAVKDPARVAFLTQTTLSIDDTKGIIEVLKRRFPEIRGPKTNDICYATQNRQNAVKELAKTCPVILVIGSATSSNSNRLVEVARACGARAHLVEDPGSLDATLVSGVETLGVTSGASTPEVLVEGVLKRLHELCGIEGVEELETVREHVAFPLPVEISRRKSTALA